MPGFEIRGVIEGFYGRPWSHEDRRFVIERIGRLGMNRYVYAPKDDPLHLARWREPYPSETLREFEALVACGRDAGVDVGFSVSPGRSIAYGSAEDRRRLVEKFRAFHALGARHLTLAVDDVPSALVHESDRASFASLAAAHAMLMHELAGAFAGEAALGIVPTDYLGVEPTDYLEELGEALPGEIEVGWTGRTVVSPEIRTAEAAARAKTLRRRLLVWDNTPVSDGPMRCMLHLGPYAGRDADLCQQVRGVLLNPMEHARASLVTVATAAAYLRDPEAYDPEAAWSEAIDALGGPAAAALRCFAAAHRFSALRPGDRDAELEAGLAELAARSKRGAPLAPVLSGLSAQVALRSEAAEALRRDLPDARLLAELEPWIAGHHAETARIRAALDLLATLEGPAARSAKTFAFFAFESARGREAPPSTASYGPRRVLYPQLVSMRDDAMGFGDDPALFLDRCLADAFVALAESHAARVLGVRRG
jgi:hyaluronoglucosaminidase